MSAKAVVLNGEIQGLTFQGGTWLVMFSAQNLEGTKVVSLSEFKGKPVQITVDPDPKEKLSAS